LRRKNQEKKQEREVSNRILTPMQGKAAQQHQKKKQKRRAVLVTPFKGIEIPGGEGQTRWVARERKKRGGKKEEHGNQTRSSVPSTRDGKRRSTKKASRKKERQKLGARQRKPRGKQSRNDSNKEKKGRLRGGAGFRLLHRENLPIIRQQDRGKDKRRN